MGTLKREIQLFISFEELEKDMTPYEMLSISIFENNEASIVSFGVLILNFFKY